MSVSELLKAAAEGYLNVKKEPFSNVYTGPEGNLFIKDIPLELKKMITLNENVFLVEGSIGKGNFAEVPWIAIMDKSITDKTSKGFYIVFLFSADMQSIYLTLNQGTEYLKENDINDISHKICAKFFDGRQESIAVNLGAKGIRGKSYEDACILGYKYDVSTMPDDIEIKENLESLLRDYETVKNFYDINGKSIEGFYKAILDDTDDYQQFKYLLNRFATQASINISDKTNRKPSLGEEGFEKNNFKNSNGYDTINLSNKEIHIHLHNTGSYGPKNGEGSSKVPYFCYDLDGTKWANVYIGFHEYEAKSFEIAIWDADAKKNNKRNTALFRYKISSLDLFSSKGANDCVKKMHDDFFNILPNDNVASGVSKAVPIYATGWNKILYGPPGTGKTFSINEIKKSIFANQSFDDGKGNILKEDFFINIITFHQSYGYEDFIEGISAVTENGNISYCIKDGVFKKFCKNAEEYPDKNFLFVIDEINRGNISKIFGELITLIELPKRIGAEEEFRVVLPYSGELFGVPKNVFLLGTMNTADRSIAMLDTALRRRFEFEEKMPHLKIVRKKIGENGVIDNIDVANILDVINQRIEFLHDRNHTLGHAFFLHIQTMEDLKNVFENKIIPLLQEYFYEDYAKIKAVLNDTKNIYITKVEFRKTLFSGDFNDLINDYDTPRYRIKTGVLMNDFILFAENITY